MDIYLYLDNQDLTPITTFNDVASNPFKEGDEITLIVDELHAMDIMKFKLDFQEKMEKSNKELQEQFSDKKIKLVDEQMFVKFKVATEPKLIVEYFCKFL